MLDAVQPGTGQIWLDDIRCRGDERALDDCQHRDWGVHNCAHNKDVGIHCSVSFPTTSTAASTTLTTTRSTTVSTIPVARPEGTCIYTYAAQKLYYLCFTVTERQSWLWLYFTVTVRNIFWSTLRDLPDLSRHCCKSIIGNYRRSEHNFFLNL